MIGFWVTGAVAVLLVLALLFRPFLIKSANASVSRKQLNAAIYRDQLVRLDRDRAENTLAEADYEQARTELQRRVIDDTAQEDATTTMQAPRRTMVALGLLLPIAAIGLYILVGNPAAMQPSSAASQTPDAMPDMEKLTAGLAKKLEQEPDNLQGWAMLGRSYKMIGRNVEAEQAFARAGAFLDTDAQLLAIYADLAATNANGVLAGKPTQLIEKALKVDPENPMALWLAGSAAFQAGQFDAAIRVWERLIQQIEPDTDDWRMLRESIDAAYAASGKSAPKATNQELIKPNPAQSTNGTPSTTSAKTGASVSGHVELDAALKSKASPNDTVMIIARMPGVRMPVAVLRAKVSELPIKFTLDDSLSMSPQARISAASEVEVEARISKSGMAQSEPGDLISAVQTVKVGATGLTLQVNKVRP